MTKEAIKTPNKIILLLLNKSVEKKLKKNLYCIILRLLHSTVRILDISYIQKHDISHFYIFLLQTRGITAGTRGGRKKTQYLPWIKVADEALR
mgnify:CR=1 FL=1